LRIKALLGSEENRNLLVHFLNAVLADDLSAPIAVVERRSYKVR